MSMVTVICWMSFYFTFPLNLLSCFILFFSNLVWLFFLFGKWRDVATNLSFSLISFPCNLLALQKYFPCFLQFTTEGAPWSKKVWRFGKKHHSESHKLFPQWIHNLPWSAELFLGHLCLSRHCPAETVWLRWCVTGYGTWTLSKSRVSQKGAEISGGSLASCVNKVGSTNQIPATQELT